MDGGTGIIKATIRSAVLATGIVLFFALVTGIAGAQTTSTTTTTSTSTDLFYPVVITFEASESGLPDEAVVDAEFVDAGTGVNEQTESIEVDDPDAEVSECVKSSHDGKKHVKCKVKKLKHGEHDVKASVDDHAGHHSERHGKLKITDKEPPVIDSITTDPTQVTVLYHDPEPSSGIASVVVYLDGDELNCNAIGSNCHDDDDDGDDISDDGDTADSDSDGHDYSSHGYYHDSGGSLHPSDGFFHDHDDDEGGAHSGGYTCTIESPLDCGIHQVEVTITDKAGHVTTGTATIDTGDCDPPVTVDDAPAGWQNTDVTVTLSCSDTGSGCAATTYEVDAGATQYGNSVLLTTDGAHTITYRSTDNAGNVEADNTATVMIDKTPPEITTSGDQTVEATGPDGAAASYTADAIDLLSGVASFDCSPASGGVFPLGSTTVNCAATDNAGNASAGSFTISVVDTTPPAVTYVSPIDTIYDTTSPTITGTATDAVGVVSASASIDGGPAITCTVDISGNVSCPTTTLAYGWHTADISATDAAGNTGTASGAFCVSSGRPNLTLYKVSGPYLISVAPDHSYAIVGVDYRMDNSGPDAFNVHMTSMTANNGIYLLDPLPVLGDIAAGGSIPFTVQYYWPSGVSQYIFTNTACAEDQCLTQYFYP